MALCVEGLCCVTTSKVLFDPVIRPARLGIADALVWRRHGVDDRFHFCFDLSHFWLLVAELLADPVWTLQRTFIVSLFCCVQDWASRGDSPGSELGCFGRRWIQIAACALLVTLGSSPCFRQFHLFRVLHGMAVMLVVAGTCATAGGGMGCAGGWRCAGIALGGMRFLTGPLAHWAVYFNAPSLNWLGLISRKPFTEDYVPLLPWLGVMWWGWRPDAGRWKASPLVAVAPAYGLQGLAVLGRWSLSYYCISRC